LNNYCGFLCFDGGCAKRLLFGGLMAHLEAGGVWRMVEPKELKIPK